LEMLAMTRRMILPDRVLGMSETIHTFFGRAILPISRSMAALTWCRWCTSGTAAPRRASTAGRRLGRGTRR
jgi:hypothetical protein